MRYLVYLMTLLFVGTAIAQNPTIVQGNYITNVFGNSNFVLNPNALTNVANVAVSNATVTRVASTTNSLVATTEFNVTVTSANGTIAWNTRAFDNGMKGQNCEARFTYRGFQSTSVAQVRQGATVAGANVVARLALTASTDPRIASINFPCGDLSQPTYFVITDTATLSGTHEIGGIYVGLATNMANVAQAEAVVDVGRNTAQSIPTSVATTIIYNTETTDVLGEYDTSNGKFTAKRAGEYLVTSTVLYSSVAWTAGQIAQIIILKDGATICSNIQNVATTATQYVTEKIACKVTLSVGNVLETQTLHQRGTNTDIFNNPAFTRMQIYRFPSSSELVVTPERQNVWGAVQWPSNTNYTFATTSTTAVDATNVAFASASGTYFGGAKASATANVYGMKMENIPVGVYRISVKISTHNQSGSNDCTSELHDNSGLIGSSQSSIQNNSWNNGGKDIVAIYRVTSFQALQDFKVKLRSGNVATTCSINASNGGTQNPSIVFEPLDQPSNSALYVQGPVLGAQTGAAISAGYVGEEVTQATATVTTVTVSANTEVDVTNANITLGVGVWELQYFADVYIERTPASTSNIYGRIRITDSSNTLEANTESFFGNTNNASSLFSSFSSVSRSKRIAITSGTKTFKLRITCTQANTVGVCAAAQGDQTGAMSGLESSTYIRAVRIN